MGEFWLIKDPLEVKDRLTAFKKFLDYVYSRGSRQSTYPFVFDS